MQKLKSMRRYHNALHPPCCVLTVRARLFLLLLLLCWVCVYLGKRLEGEEGEEGIEAEMLHVRGKARYTHP